MKALILCAGKGTRLMPHTLSVPKCLVPVCGAPILDHQLRALQGLVDEVVLVTGHLHEAVQSFAGARSTIVRNEDYETTNSLHSLWLARQAIGDSAFVLLNGDLVVDAQLVGKLIDHQAATAALIDSHVQLRDGEMNVVIDGDRIVEFSKHIPSLKAHAQSLQITKFGAADGGLLFERVDALIQAGESGRFPAYAYDRILERSRMAPVERDGGMWFEIDTVDDLARCESALADAVLSR